MSTHAQLAAPLNLMGRGSSTQTKTNAQITPFYRKMRSLGSQMQGEVISLTSASYAGAGHGKGDLWAQVVAEKLSEMFPGQAFAHYEYLNHLLAKNPKSVSVPERKALLGSPVRQLLLNRSDGAFASWSEQSPFQEKQDDTADFIVERRNGLYLIDVKSRETSKKTQAPNLISGLKLANACKAMLESEQYDLPELWYFSCEWTHDSSKGVCNQAVIKNLLWARPTDLYINFTAGRQIQRHLDDMDQSFYGTNEEWAKQYLEHFVQKSKDFKKKVEKTLIDPFEKILS